MDDLNAWQSSQVMVDIASAARIGWNLTSPIHATDARGNLVDFTLTPGPLIQRIVKRDVELKLWEELVLKKREKYGQNPWDALDGEAYTRDLVALIRPGLRHGLDQNEVAALASAVHGRECPQARRAAVYANVTITLCQWRHRSDGTTVTRTL